MNSVRCDGAGVDLTGGRAVGWRRYPQPGAPFPSAVPAGYTARRRRAPQLAATIHPARRVRSAGLGPAGHRHIEDVEGAGQGALLPPPRHRPARRRPATPARRGAARLTMKSAR